MSFQKLETVLFQDKLKNAACEIYKMVWPGCKVIPLQSKTETPNLLDKVFGIDLFIQLETNSKITIQEKFRANHFLKYTDFTQEYKNAEGTNFESNGEWFNLAADVYFYGWSDHTESFFVKWALIDILKYKLWVETVGGLDKVGSYMRNNKHGRASFYAIPIIKMIPLFLTDYRKYPVKDF